MKVGAGLREILITRFEINGIMGTGVREAFKEKGFYYIGKDNRNMEADLQKELVKFSIVSSASSPE